MTDRRYILSGAQTPGLPPTFGDGGGLRLLLAGPDALALTGLAGLLEDETDLVVVDQVVPAATGAADLTRAIRLQHPDLVVWDSGSEAALPEELTGLAAGEIPVLALVATEEAAQAALGAGARGATLRSGPPERIAASVRAISQGLIVLDDEFADSLVRRLRVPVPELLADPLTAREQEVVQLMAQGLSNKAIGERLHISEHTAKFHVNAILSKLDAQTRTEAVVRAARMGLILL
jgi:two-component system, NarL family, nitrate/nitrite response regulator NarL